MTISITTNKTGPTAGDGVVTSFNYNFRIDDEDDLVVIHTDAAGVEPTLTIRIHILSRLGLDRDSARRLLSVLRWQDLVPILVSGCGSDEPLPQGQTQIDPNIWNLQPKGTVHRLRHVRSLL